MMRLLWKHLPASCGVMIVVLVGNLFYLGAKPVAVGLFQEPWDKLAHALTFGMLAALWSGVFRARRPWATLLVVGLIAAGDEVHQIWLPGRSADFTDFLADIAAAGLVVAATRIHGSWRSVRGS